MTDKTRRSEEVNVMNMPRFTAEASLYQKNGCYQPGSGRHAVNLSAQMNSSICPAETIEVHGCQPGYSLWEESGDWGCIRDDPFGGGGDGGGVTPPGDGGGGGGGGGGNGSVSVVDKAIGDLWHMDCHKEINSTIPRPRNPAAAISLC